jgi:RecA-family ATPase
MIADTVEHATAVQVDQLDHQVSLSWFRNCTDIVPVRETQSFGELVLRLSEPDARQEKDGSCFMPAIFKASGHRSEADVERLTGIALDFDRGSVTQAIIESKLADLSYIAYTTYRSTREKRRWRVFIPYSASIRPAQHSAVYQYFASVFRDELDDCCAKVCQLAYAPACPHDSAPQFVAFHRAGAYFDPLAVQPSARANLKDLWERIKAPLDLTGELREGTRNELLSRYAWKLLHERTSLEELPGLVREWNRTHGNPPVDDREIDGIVNNAVRNFKKDFPAKFEQLFGGDKAAIGSTSEAVPLFYVNAARIDFMLDTQPPPARFLLKNMMRLGKVSLLVAPGGTGKSQFSLQLMVSIATGLAMANVFEVDETGAALGLFAEEDTDELHRRLKHTVDGLGLSEECQRRLRERLFIKSMTATDNLMTQKGKDGEITKTDYLARLLAVVRGITDLKLIIIDPASRFRGGDEIDNNGATRMVEVLEELVQATGATVMLVHHTNKFSQNVDESNQSAARGASALVDGVRLVMNLSPMSKKEAEHLGVKPAQKNGYVKVAVTKNNYAPPQAADVWLERGDHGILTKASLSAAGRDNGDGQRKDTIVEIVRREAGHGRQYTASSFNSHFGGRKGDIGVGDKRLRALIVELIEDGGLICIEPLNPKKNVTKVLAIPSTPEQYRVASNGE